MDITGLCGTSYGDNRGYYNSCEGLPQLLDGTAGEAKEEETNIHRKARIGGSVNEKHLNTTMANLP